MSDWHTLQLITGALPLSGDVRGEYGGGFSLINTGGWVELGNGGKPKKQEIAIADYDKHSCKFYCTKSQDKTKIHPIYYQNVC